MKQMLVILLTVVLASGVFVRERCTVTTFQRGRTMNYVAGRCYSTGHVFGSTTRSTFAVGGGVWVSGWLDPLTEEVEYAWVTR